MKKENKVMKTESKAKIKRVLRVLAEKSVKIGESAVQIARIVLGLSLRAAVGIYRRFPNMSYVILLMFVLNAILICLSCPGFVIKYVFDPLFLLLLVAGMIKDVFRMLVSFVALKWGSGQR